MLFKRECEIFKLKGFSLAEILIVMVVIGVIATLTMPQLIGGVDEAHYKAGLKKAYTSLVNIVAIEKANDSLPQVASFDSRVDFFRALDSNLDVEGYAVYVEEGKKIEPQNIKMGAKWGTHTFGDTSDMVEVTQENANSPWIITADGMAFLVGGTGGSCGKKASINRATYSGQLGLSCLTIQVDVNGVTRGPNQNDPQRTLLTSTTKLKKLQGDRFNFYLGNDGLAKGSPIYTITGRILAGEK